MDSSLIDKARVIVVAWSISLITTKPGIWPLAKFTHICEPSSKLCPCPLICHVCCTAMPLGIIQFCRGIWSFQVPPGADTLLGPDKVGNKIWWLWDLWDWVECAANLLIRCDLLQHLRSALTFSIFGFLQCCWAGFQGIPRPGREYRERWWAHSKVRWCSGISCWGLMSGSPERGRYFRTIYFLHRNDVARHWSWNKLA